MRLITITGGSGAGKTTVAHALAESLDGAAVLSLDRYYRDQAHLPLWDRAQYNFDHPDAIEFSLLEAHLDSLLSGEPVEVPRYDYNTHVRVAPPGVFAVERVLVLEGLHAFYPAFVRDRSDCLVFLETDPAVCLSRRIVRDERERGRTEAVVRAQFRSTVLPMYERFVAPGRAYADVVLDGGLPLAALRSTLLREVSMGE